MRITKPSVQSLFLRMRFNAQVIATATGFVVQSRMGPLLMTNRHNVTGRNCQTGQPCSKTGAIPNEIEVIHNRKGRLGQWLPKLEPLLGAGESPLWIEHPRWKEKADFVALPLTSVDEVDLYPYELLDIGPEIHLGPSEVCSVVGFPFGLQAGGSLAVWATGFIASEPEVDFQDLPVFLVDCRSRPGQSGSAVVAHRGGGSFGMKDGSTAIITGSVTQLLGIYSGRINEQSDLGIVWKRSAILELVNAL